MIRIQDWAKEALLEEVMHFQDLGSLILTRRENLALLRNIGYYAAVEPFKGTVSGDHLIVPNFAEYSLPDKTEKAKQAGNHLLAAKLESNFDRFGILDCRRYGTQNQ